MEMPAEDEPWAILSSEKLDLKRKIEDVGVPLKDWNINIYRGIVTGCNEAFIIDEAKREELIAQDANSADIIKPLLRGRNIKRYKAVPSGFYILATGYDLDVPNRYPAIYNHLETIGQQIESGELTVRGRGLFNRDDQGENWWNLRACAYYSEFERKKIVWQRVCKDPGFAFIQNPMFCLDTTCIATSEKVKFLTAILNSRVSHYLFYILADIIVSVDIVERLLVPPITNENQHIATQIEDFVDQILDAKQADPDADTSSLENKIDKLVYELYNLTEDEIAIVEGAV